MTCAMMFRGTGASNIKVRSGYTGLRHVRAAHAAVREYCEGVAAYSPDSGVSPMVKRKLLETILCIALSMKFAAMGSASHRFVECVAAWLGLVYAGSIPEALRVKARSDAWAQDPDMARKTADVVTRFPSIGALDKDKRPNAKR